MNRIGIESTWQVFRKGGVVFVDVVGADLLMELSLWSFGSTF